MKPKNFPARKKQRQINAARDANKPYTAEEMAEITTAQTVRTKKRRASAQTRVTP